MTTSDVRDVLNLDGGHAGGPRPSKKQRLTAPKSNLKGLAREVQSLGGDAPIAIIAERRQFKKRRFANRKPAARWENRAFRNSARDDETLVLRHWRRLRQEVGHIADADANKSIAPGAAAGVDGNSGEAPTEDMPDAPGPQPADGNGEAVVERPVVIDDSEFAKYNAQVEVPEYSDDQYEVNLTSDDWTKEETDYLMSLVRQFDLRWNLIWDRYDFPRPSPPAQPPADLKTEAEADGMEQTQEVPPQQPAERTMEDLKARYYGIAAKTMALGTRREHMTREDGDLHDRMAGFDPLAERQRKEFAETVLARSRDEAREEESLLVEIRRIQARTERFNDERADLYRRLDTPRTDQSGTELSRYKTSAGLAQLLTEMIAQSKKRRSFVAGEGAPGPSPAGAAGAGPVGRGAAGTAGQEIPTPSSAGPAGGHSRRESLALSASGERSAREAAGTTGGKKGDKTGGAASAAARRQLTEHEEAVYGVTRHDRLPGGVAFRFEKISKGVLHKSALQQTRISNTLTELSVPPRLVMPTVRVAAEYERLLAAINILIDARKLADKAEAELRAESARLGVPMPGASTAGGGAANGTDGRDRSASNATAPVTKDGQGQESVAGADATDGANGETQAQAEEKAGNADGNVNEVAKPEGSVVDGQAETAAETSGVATATGSSGGLEPPSATGTTGASRGSVAGHKRSASVLSSTSVRSSKRLKE